MATLTVDYNPYGYHGEDTARKANTLTRQRGAPIYNERPNERRSRSFDGRINNEGPLAYHQNTFNNNGQKPINDQLSLDKRIRNGHRAHQTTNRLQSSRSAPRLSLIHI